MTRYPYHVALMVPDLARQAANIIIVDATGNPADLNSFAVECRDEHNATWWACQLPMQPHNFARLPELQAALGGHYEVLREYGAVRVEIMTLDEALAMHGLSRVEVDDE